MNPTESQQMTANREVDILVIGGGPAGVAAAFAAARQGCKVLIIEQCNCLGGVATSGGHGHICQYTSWANKEERVVGGIPWEMAERISAMGYGEHNVIEVDFEVEAMKLLLDRMAEETGTEILYHSMYSETVVENGAVTGVIIQNKSGRQLITAKQVIDCTGDGDVAAGAGCDYLVGDEDTGDCQPVTLMFTIGGVDWARVQKFRNSEPDSYQLKHIWKKAQDAGDMRPFQHNIMGWWHTSTRPDQVGVNFTHVNYVDTTKAEDITSATIEARKQAYETIEVYRKYIPGMENCHMVSTPAYIGTRESRRITGEYTLTRDDLVAEKEFDDSIGYGSFFIDIHGTSGPGMDKKTYYPPKGFKYQIPYRIIVPEKIDNLLVAGRCASATHEALGSLRVMPQCGLMGEAAGIAAHLAIKHNTVPRKIDVSELQKILKDTGGIIHAEDIVSY